ncbi:ABC transporter permease [Ruania halotolerans]|uniref:ABC transporter permease n=1 Tax=Ruania halotolerans TaxID=2897773 RepID=UPI001E430EAF|nr:ABC transporter permease [Ruania halotolerans]UFU05409.1 ABC transporter permease [Ruania halotolerans]
MSAPASQLVAPAAARLRLGAVDAIFIARSLRHSIRNVDAMLMAVLLPVILMLLFVYVFGGAFDPSGDYVNYVVPGIILLCAGFGASSTAIDVAGDKASGIMDRFRTLPIRSWAVVTGHVVASLVRNLVATAVVLAVALGIGFRPSAGVGEWLLAIGAVAAYILAITYLFAAIGLATGSPEAANGYGFVLLFLPYLSTAFVGAETLPTWLRGFAEHQPITPVIETLRSLLMGTPAGSAPVLALAWTAAILAAAVVWSATLFARQAGRR